MSIHHLSHSTVSDWKECGEKVRLRKIEKVPSSPSWSLVGGSLVHFVTEAQDFKDFGIEVEDRPHEFSKEVFDTFISLEEERSGVPASDWKAAGRPSKEWPDKENYDWWVHNGPVQVRNWRRWITSGLWQVAIDPDGNPAIEIEFSEEIGGAPVVGFIDRVLERVGTRELMVVDLKSGSRDPMSSEQIGLYRRALEKKHGGRFTPSHGSYFMTRKGVTTPPVDLEKYSDGRLEYDYSSVWSAIRADIFVPKIGPLCPSCGVRDFCRAVDGPHADEHLPYRKDDK